LRLPNRPQCSMRSGTTCKHPGVGGDANDDRCATCRMYVGRARGLGDIVHTAAKWTGAAAVVHAIDPNGKCGCDQRRAALNAAVPFTDTTRQETNDGPNL
jgi:hypothetical protein